MKRILTAVLIALIPLLLAVADTKKPRYIWWEGESAADTNFPKKSWFSPSTFQQNAHLLSGGQRNRVHLARILKEGANVILLDEPTNDLDVNTLRALEEALDNFGGCAVVISHDRWFLDRLATHILAFEGDSQVNFFDGNYTEYEEDRKKRLGEEACQPHRIKYRHLTR